MRIIVVLILSVVFAARLHAQNRSELEVLVFLGAECPISQKYVNTLNTIYQDYKKRGVLFTALFPEKISTETLENFKAEFGVAFPCALDKKMKRARQLKATITPEVFLLLQGKVVYQGAIDDWFYELGKYRKEVTQHYLINALEATLSNQEIAIKKTEALGCFIQLKR